MGKRYVVPNPACGGVKPVQLITDRAKRYRANKPGCAPPGPRVCEYCGSDKNVDVHHRDGDESNGRKSNLAYACRSCNMRIANWHMRSGKGVRTRQFNGSNPRKWKGQLVPTYAEYIQAANVEHKRKAFDFGGSIIHQTPPDLRRLYAARAWATRRQRGTDKWKSDIPF